MKFRYSPVALAVLAALGSAAVTPATAQQQPQAQSQTLERVTITGSNIRRTDMETVSPVEIITREAIERSGSQTVSDLLTKLPQTGSAVFNDYANSFAPGATSVSLRALGQKATLVLLNGRRVAGYGFGQNISEVFVDLSQIPTAAIDRVEVLLDGASAIYGSDAIAGVVNVILRRDFQGVEVSGNVGFYQGVNDYRANLTAGWGDLGKDKFNVMGVLDYYKRDGLTLADTDFGASRDYRSREGGRNFQSLSGGTWQGAGGVRRAYSECPTPVDYQQSVALGLQTVANSNRPLGTAPNIAGNTWCLTDYAKYFSVVPDQEKIAFMGRGTYQVKENVLAYGELGYTQNKVDFVFQPSAPGQPAAPGTRFVPVPAPTFFQAYPFAANYAPGASGNPLSGNATYAGVFWDFGPRTNENTSDAWRALGGLQYSFGSWDFNSAAWYSQSKVSSTRSSALTSGTISGLGMPASPEPLFPVVTNGPYNLDRPSQNSPALRASMFNTFSDANAKSQLYAVDTNATTNDIGWNLPGGPAALAVGFYYANESIKNTPGDVVQQGEALGLGSTAVDGSRTNFATYLELSLPLVKNLEVQVAGRYDWYSDFGAAFTPKIGAKWKPANEWLLRANWGRGFKAPSLPEITPSSSFFFLNGVSDPNAPGATPDNPATINTSGQLNANANLKPEESVTFTAGVIFEPNANFNAGVNYYKIKWTNQVSQQDYQALINANDPANVKRDPLGSIYAVVGTFQNLGEISTDGVDLNVTYKLPTAYGRWGALLNATYVNSFTINGEEAAGSNVAWICCLQSAIPRWKGLATLSWEQGPWVGQLTVNYTHSYWRTWGTTLFPSYFRPGTAGGIPQNGTLDPKSPSFTTFDLYGRYNVTPKFTIDASIVNLLDKEPIFDPSFSTTYFYDRTMYDIRGRIFRVGANYKF